jgi:hypothetical protein
MSGSFSSIRSATPSNDDDAVYARAQELKIIQNARINSRASNDSRYFLNILTRLTKHPTPTGYPKYGYLMEHNGALVGAILLIFTKVQSDDSATIRCHLTQWYVIFYESTQSQGCHVLEYSRTADRTAVLTNPRIF